MSRNRFKFVVKKLISSENKVWLIPHFIFFVQKQLVVHKIL